MNTLPNSSRVSFENPKAWPHSGSFSTNNPLETDYTAVRPWESFKSRYHWQNLVVCFYHCSFYKFYEFLLQLNFTEKAVNRCACLLFHSLWFPGTTKVGSALVEWRRRWHPTPVLLPGKSHGRRSLVGYSPGVVKSQTQLSDFTFTLHFHALKEMATHCSVLAWRIPGTAEHGGLPSMGSHRVGHDWNDLAAAAAYVESIDINFYSSERFAGLACVVWFAAEAQFLPFWKGY